MAGVDIAMQLEKTTEYCDYILNMHHLSDKGAKMNRNEVKTTHLLWLH